MVCLSAEIRIWYHTPSLSTRALQHVMTRLDGNTASLEGEIALVTGGGTGLGFAIASCLQKAGARVVITGRRRDVLHNAAREIGPSAVAIVADLSELAT